MKKNILAIFVVFLSIFLCSCEKSPNLLNNVSQLRSNLYIGYLDENFSVSASYFFKEEPEKHDGKVGDIRYYLSFKLNIDPTDNVTYTISLKVNDKNYTKNFSFDPVSSLLSCKIETEMFVQDKFNATISYGGNSQEIEFNSIIPKNTISYKDVILVLEKEQSAFLKNYTDNYGNFNAEIILRILMKNEHPYWYVGITDSEEELKAFLIDGFTSEILAIRKIV